MLSKRCERTLLMTLTALISLTLVAMGPFVSGNPAIAAESSKMVDITYENDNLYTDEIDDSEIDVLSEEGTEIDSDEELDEISEEIDAESDVIDEDSDDESDEIIEKHGSGRSIDEEYVEESEEESDEIVEKHGSRRSIEEEDNAEQDADSEGGESEMADLDAAANEDEEIVIDDQYINEDTDEDDDEIEEIDAQVVEEDVDEEAENAEEDVEEDTEEVDEDSEDNVKKADEDKDDKDAEEEVGETEANTDLNGSFPASYQPLIEELQAAHPNWTFVPVETGVSWKTALDAEDNGGTSVVDPDEDESMRADSDKKYDGKWYRSNRKTLAYYMDPRNFLNDDGIYQFLVQTYSSEGQNVDSVASVIDGSFMEGKNPGDGFDTFQACIENAGEETGVNANVLAAMIIQEQGWDGSSLVSGEKEGYEGIYNFFNIGAWTTGDKSSVERGLWYAQGEGEGNTSYDRPWDEPYKAIFGGAKFYYENYICANQATYYTKKFNVLNGEDAIGEHQYMTNVSGAYEEGRLVSKAYENSGIAATFEIPVYQDMPVDTCELPE